MSFEVEVIKFNVLLNILLGNREKFYFKYNFKRRTFYVHSFTSFID